MLPKQNGYITILVIFTALVILVGAGSYLLNNQNDQVKGSHTLNQANIISPPASPWKTYTNNILGFDITYPRVGVVVTEEGYQQGECGLAIKESSKETILIDNFYKIKTVDWEGTLDEYLVKAGAKNSYETAPLEGSGAEEAVELLRLKEGFEIAVGYPPLAFTKAVFKKGDNIYLMQTFNVVNNFGGCILPATADPTQFSDYHKLDWNILTSIKFN